MIEDLGMASWLRERPEAGERPGNVNGLPQSPVPPTTAISDALDAFGLSGATSGLRPLWFAGPPIAGPVTTVLLDRNIPAAGGGRHLGIAAIEACPPGGLIVIDNGGRLAMSCFGGILAAASKISGVAGIIADGACRDTADFERLRLPVFARAGVVASARGRVREIATNVPVRCAGVDVRPGDWAAADVDGVVFVPRDEVGRVFGLAAAIQAREDAVVRDLRSGKRPSSIADLATYESWLSDDRRAG